MIINKIEIEQLFGLYNYYLDFNRKNVSFITATNGAGKTTILNLIKSIFLVDALFIDQIPFKRITITVDDYKIIGIEKEEVYASFTNQSYYDMYNYIQTKKLVRFPFKYIINDSSYNIDINRDFLIAYFRRGIHRDYDVFSDEISNKTSMKKIIAQFPIRLFHNAEIIDAIKKKINDNISIVLIDANRLVSFHKKEESDEEISGESITDYKNELKQIINDVQKVYGDTSTEIDKGFPNKVFKLFSTKRKTKYESSIEKVIDTLKKLSERRKNLSDIGLIINAGGESIIPNNIDLSDEKVIEFLALYLEEMNKKFDVFDDIYEKLSLFISLINNNNNYIDKTMQIGKDAEIEFVSKNGRPISLESLSSGEKHNLILLYNLIFNTDNNTLLLIDEPEISLHVLWQEGFTDALIKISELKKIQSLVATHSPNIINDYYDNVVELDHESK